MNKRQLEVQKRSIADEKEILQELKKIYTRASRDCADKIMELSMRTDLENLQTIIYQKQYQEALKKQIDGVLEQLDGNSFATVADYLSKTYENGFIGVLYDLHGQGIPLVFPMDQEKVVQALQVDSKISSGLYKRMGEDTNKLKKSIRTELSRGIANGSSWNQIAIRIAMGMNSPFKKALNRTMTIVRTEGHRIQQEASFQCQQEARGQGANVEKQWDATMDGITRPHHRELDGQLRDVDKPFEVAGKKAMYPGGFGDPSEDCNCRCCLLQRAKWALDEGELETLKERAEFFGLDKTKDFDEFKQKYLEAATKSADARIVDVTAEYFRNAFPGSGKIIHDKGVDDPDKNVSELLHSTFGGDIHTLEVENVGGVDKKTPDAFWRGTYWEYKQVSSDTSVDDRMKKAWRQLRANAERKGLENEKVGIVIDISNYDQEQEKSISRIEEVFLLRVKVSADLIITKGESIIKVIRK